MILLDTSVWVMTFRRRDPLDLESIACLDEVVTCLPVVQEVLQGFRHERAHRLASDAMGALPCVESPMPDDVFLHAADLYRAARRQGWTVRSSIDCMVAACAIRNDLQVVHADRDYEAIAHISALRQHSIGN